MRKIKCLQRDATSSYFSLGFLSLRALESKSALYFHTEYPEVVSLPGEVVLRVTSLCYFLRPEDLLTTSQGAQKEKPTILYY